MKQLAMLMTADEIRETMTETLVGDFIPGEPVTLGYSGDTVALLSGDLTQKGFIPVTHVEMTDTFAQFKTL